MEKLKDASLSNDEPDQTFSDYDGNKTNGDSNESNSSKYEALTDELQTKINDLIKAIRTTKCVTTETGMLDADAYQKVENLIASIDSIIKCHEDDINCYQSHIYSNEVPHPSQSAELNQKITELEAALQKPALNDGNHEAEATTRIHRVIRAKQLTAAAYEKLKAFIDSVENVFECYETKDKQNQDTINSLLDGISRCADGTDQRYKELHQIIDEQNDFINRLIENSETMEKEYEGKMKAMQEKLKQAVQAEMEAKYALMEQKEQETNKKLKQVEADSINYMFEFGDVDDAPIPKAIRKNPAKDVDKISDAHAGAPAATSSEISQPAENESFIVADKKKNDEDASIAKMRNVLEKFGVKQASIDNAVAAAVKIAKEKAAQSEAAQLQ